MTTSAMPWLAAATVSDRDAFWIGFALVAVFLGFIAIGYIAGPRRPKKIEAKPDRWYCEYARGPGEEV